MATVDLTLINSLNQIGNNIFMKLNYSNYKFKTFNCPKCNWRGLGSEAFLSDLSEIHTLRDVECPKCDETLHTFDLAEKKEDKQKFGSSK